MIRRGYQFGIRGSYREEGWTVKLPKNIEDVPEDTLLYVRGVIAEGFDAGKPVDHDKKRAHPKGRIIRLPVPNSEDTRVDRAVPISQEIIEGTRDYLETVLRQLNGCYARWYYDACAVMLCHLTETLIIDCYESYGIAEEIKNAGGSFVGLDDLFRRFLYQKEWNVGRDERRLLKKLPLIKGIGDLAAHNRRFTATKNDIDLVVGEARVAIQ